MSNLTIVDLENCINGAIENNAKYIGMSISIPMYEKPEVIINDITNAEKKLDYYKFAYDDNLTLGNGIKIIGFTYGNSFAEIQDNLIGVGE